MERGYREGTGTYEQDDLGGGGAPGKRTRTQELPAPMRTQFESSLGADLSSVRLHTGEDSAQAASELGARAFTTGNDIHFGAGQFQPDDPFGMHLIAHEVAHTQQPDSGAPRLKGEGDAPASNPDEAAADQAADAMVAGQPAAHFVPFKVGGTWDAAQVLAGLGSVPPAMRAAIEEGVRATAQFCVELRKAVQAAGGDPSIVAALTSRITELTFATSRSPLTYGQLRDVAAWSEQFGTGSAAKAESATDEAKQPTPPGSSDPIEARAAKIAGAGAGYVHDGKAKDPYRKDIKGLGPNQVIPGEDADPPLAGHDFRYDPFDNTVVVVRREEGTGIQYTYDAVKTDEGVTMKLVRTEELSKLRVGALVRMDEAAMGEKQEDDAQRKARIANDRANDKIAREKWAAANPEASAAYNQQIKDWQALPEEQRKKTPAPKPPNGYPADLHTTLCPAFVSKPYNAGGGKDSGKLVNFTFTPPIKEEAASWRTLETNPEGPRPGDVYWIAFTKGGMTAHMGVVKSRSPADVAGQEMWVVTDGGQGGYEQIQMAYERLKGPFDPATGYFGETSDSGQKASKRYLTGWIDIEAFHKHYGGEQEIVEV